ncbi:hypothetical protein [Mycobacterium sp. PSTR-4-N]|nr:hypothetical protein [Mycobacterium sp. PSTR-4-N]MCG7595759.1 hypothetical protein [Mycobacterium sp. PSTR-4-N]
MRRESRYARHRRRMNEQNFKEQLLQRGESSFDGWVEVVDFDDDPEEEQ